MDGQGGEPAVSSSSGGGKDDVDGRCEMDEEEDVDEFVEGTELRAGGDEERQQLCISPRLPATSVAYADDDGRGWSGLESELIAEPVKVNWRTFLVRCFYPSLTTSSSFFFPLLSSPPLPFRFRSL